MTQVRRLLLSYNNSPRVYSRLPSPPLLLSPAPLLSPSSNRSLQQRQRYLCALPKWSAWQKRRCDADAVRPLRARCVFEYARRHDMRAVWPQHHLWRRDHFRGVLGLRGGLDSRFVSRLLHKVQCRETQGHQSRRRKRVARVRELSWRQVRCRRLRELFNLWWRHPRRRVARQLLDLQRWSISPCEFDLGRLRNVPTVQVRARQLGSLLGVLRWFRA